DGPNGDLKTAAPFGVLYDHTCEETCVLQAYKFNKDDLFYIGPPEVIKAVHPSVKNNPYKPTVFVPVASNNETTLTTIAQQPKIKKKPPVETKVGPKDKTTESPSIPNGNVEKESSSHCERKTKCSLISKKDCQISKIRCLTSKKDCLISKTSTYLPAEQQKPKVEQPILIRTDTQKGIVISLVEVESNASRTHSKLLSFLVFSIHLLWTLL
ncbi:hypothetical protein HMI56_003230, partial [Coelomomyces lativittatus]